jgi:hypothetical protein
MEEQEVSICQGESYTVGTSTYTESGTYTDLFVSEEGCDSNIVTALTVNPNYNVSNPVSICVGGSYTIGGSTYTEAGTYTDVFPAWTGCDSTVLTTITISSVYSVVDKVSICEGESYTIGNSTYTAAGTYSDTFTSAIGCDSIVTTVLSVYPVASTTQNAAITYTTAGTYNDVFPNWQGCDSTVTTVLTVNPSSQTDIQVTINDQGETHTLPDGTQVSQAGVYETLLENWLGCDSLVITTVEVSTSIWDLDETLDFSVFPNPSSHDFHVELLGGIQGEYRLEAYDILGRQVHASVLSCRTNPSCPTTIEAADWPPGMYTLVLRARDGRLLGAAKVVKE